MQTTTLTRVLLPALSIFGTCTTKILNAENILAILNVKLDFLAMLIRLF